MELKEALAITLALLSPLALYCLVLSFVNRRPRPLLVAGPLDFLGVVLALSGFLVVGGPAALGTLVANWHGLDRMAPPWLGRPEGGWGGVLLAVLLALYAAGVVAVVGVQLWRRRRMTAVYNVDPAEFDAALGQVLDGLGYSWTRSGNRYYVRAGSLSAVGKEPSGASLPAAPESGDVIEVEPSPGLWHVMLLWGHTAPGVRREVEGELGRGLGQVRSGPNPAAGWFLSAASMLILLLFAVLLLLLAADVLWRGAALPKPFWRAGGVNPLIFCPTRHAGSGGSRPPLARLSTEVIGRRSAPRPGRSPPPGATPRRCRSAARSPPESPAPAAAPPGQ